MLKICDLHRAQTVRAQGFAEALLCLWTDMQVVAGLMQLVKATSQPSEPLHCVRRALTIKIRRACGNLHCTNPVAKPCKLDTKSV